MKYNNSFLTFTNPFHSDEELEQLQKMGLTEHSSLPSPLAPKIIRSRPTTPCSDDGLEPLEPSKPRPKPARPPPPSRPNKPPTRPTLQHTKGGELPAPIAPSRPSRDGGAGVVGGAAAAESSSEAAAGGAKIKRQRPPSTAGVSIS